MFGQGNANGNREYSSITVNTYRSLVLYGREFMKSRFSLSLAM